MQKTERDPIVILVKEYIISYKLTNYISNEHLEYLKKFLHKNKFVDDQLKVNYNEKGIYLGRLLPMNSFGGTCSLSSFASPSSESGVLTVLLEIVDVIGAVA